MKITLLGDSICQIGYGARVSELLKNEFEVWQPEENCRFAKYTLRGIFDWSEQMKDSRIVHWNNGHWDLNRLYEDGAFSPIPEYVENMRRIARFLLSRYDRVIFATTTPTRAEHPYNSNADIRAYNAAVVPVLQEMGVIINDLYALLEPRIETYIREDDCIHLTESGIQVCAEQVATVIRKTAAEL